MAMISASGASAKWRSDTARGSTLRNEVAGAPRRMRAFLLELRIWCLSQESPKSEDSPGEFQGCPKLTASAWFLEEEVRGSMNPLNEIFSNCVTIRVCGLVVALALVLSGCSVLRHTTNSPRSYFWVSNLQTKQVHAPVACTSLHDLLTFNQLYARGTVKDKLEEATLLGESSPHAWAAPPDSPCQRAGHPIGPVTTPRSPDRVKNIKTSSDGTVSFERDFASTVAESHRKIQTYYSYPEYLVSGSGETGSDAIPGTL
jgi:hypothetical protein